MAFLPTNRINERILKKIRNRNVTSFSINLGDISNVEP